ncbi:MAG: MFS transporter, partial [Proteobacteria bacterium]|nr:MFS transporter [Pseudomonadota bacterium]
SGAAARLMGTVPSVVFGGTMTLLTVGVAFFTCHQLWALDLTKLERPQS